MDAHDSDRILSGDPDAGTYRVTYAYPSNPPSIAVPLAVAEATGRGVTDVPPMYEAGGVDPDSLDDLFRPTADGTAPECRAVFDYHGYEVTVKSYGRIVLRSRDPLGSRDRRN
ncbi:HalOD1 output domain-containing protein [Halorussus sp. AFM4]|uniref:HalOD1 output domain-containing protein n=1 Tax=Halorussus sp. AFM4 TaxID=3421651 RepID=UPI003EBF725C